MEERTRAQDQTGGNGNGLDIVSPEEDIALVYNSDWGGWTVQWAKKSANDVPKPLVWGHLVASVGLRWSRDQNPGNLVFALRSPGKLEAPDRIGVHLPTQPSN